MVDMERIEVKFFSTLQLKLGIKQLIYEGEPISVDRLIDWLQGQITRQGKHYDLRSELLFADGRIKPGTMILVDGHNVLHNGGVESMVSGKIVSIFPPSGGG